MNGFWETYAICSLGVLISILLPFLRQFLPELKKDKGETSGLGGKLQLFWTIARPYMVMGIVSLIIGLLVVAVIGDEINDWRVALLAGYSSDSTIQKLK
jgi:hypothetical protein